MMPQQGTPPSFRGLVPLGRPRDLVIKVNYGGTLKRFSASVNGSNLDHNLAALQSKIANAFKFSPEEQFILTYTDEDGDVVMLDDDDDLRDAAVSQELNPLRIDVQLKSSTAGAPQPNQQALNSRSKMSAAMEDQLAQVKSAIDEALKFVPEQVPAVLAKLSHELRSKAASSAPPVRDLLDRIAKLMTPKSGMEPTSGLSDSSSGSSSGNPQTFRDMKHNNACESATVPASHSQHAKSSRALGLKSVLVEKTNAQVQQAPGCTSIGVPSVLVGSGGKLLYHKKRTDALSKGKSHAQSMGKSVVSSSVPPVPSFAPGGSTLGSPNGYTPFGNIKKINGDSSSAFPAPRGPPPSSMPTFETIPRLPPYCSLPTHGLQKAFPPPPAYDYNQFSFSRPSAVNPYGIYQDPYSFGSYSGYGIPQQSVHKWVECDGCGVTPIVGPRYKSTVKYNYDLCSACFYRMGNEAEYARMDKPLSDKRFLQLDCRFVKDLTVPDGTRMAPSTPFRKIWCMLNNGNIVWPYGTHLAWVGGDQFARQSLVKLAIPEAGFPLNGEIDVCVDFVSPAKPGRWKSLFKPVQQPVQTSGNKGTAAVNFLSLPAEGSTATWTSDSASDSDNDGIPLRDVLATLRRKGPKAVGSVVPSAPATDEPVQVPIAYPQAADEPVQVPIAYTQAADEPVQVPVAYPHASSAEALGMPAGVAAPEAAPLPEPISVPEPLPAPTLVNSHVAPVSMPLPDQTINNNNMEEKLLRELADMGFRQVDLNKEVLRQNEYDLQKSVDDLCGFHEWDPLLAELKELGFDD
uniref:ZZ-type zinc finger-containing protein n=1 Tax=Aegilops tauschii TaxID=37682 RepID=M8CPQ7_AEGTA